MSAWSPTTSSSSARVRRRPPGLPRQALTQLTHGTLCAEVKYIIFKLSDDNKQIVVDKKSESQSYDEFVEDLPADSCRYAIYDVEFDTEGGKRNKIAFFAW